MKVSFKNPRFFAVLSILLLAFACGKKESKKQNAAAPQEKPSITSSAIDPQTGKASFQFEATGEDLYCRFDTNAGLGEWYRCDGNSAQYQLQANQSVTFRVRVGLTGPETSVTTNVWTAANTAPPAAGGENGEQVKADTKIFGGNGNVGILNQNFRIPDGSAPGELPMYVLRYSNGNGLDAGTNLEVYEVESNEDPFRRGTICMGNAATDYVNRIAEEWKSSSNANAPSRRYCVSTPPFLAAFPKNPVDDAFAGLRAHVKRTGLRFNHLELVTEPKTPLWQYASISVINDQNDIQTSRFYQQCEGNNPTVSLRRSLTMPLKNNFMPGYIASNGVQMKVCRKKATIQGGPTGDIYVGGFESLEQGMGTNKRVLEFVFMSTVDPSNSSEYDFLQKSGNFVLQHLFPNTPNWF